MKNPMFTILLPAMGRPQLVRDALISVLLQDFKDFEVIVSNNGADYKIKKSIEDLLADSRVRYIEWPELLAMPVHWDSIVKMAFGRYVTVLTDRSVLKKGALSEIAEIHSRGDSGGEIITWNWDLYYDDMQLLSPCPENCRVPKVLNSEDLMIDSFREASSYPYALPRGLNSSVSNKLIAQIREKTGFAFSSINPDYAFAYSCLHQYPKITYLNKSLMVSQGLKVSNGGNAYQTDAGTYVQTLDLAQPIFRYSPIKEYFVENLIIEDFFASCYSFNRTDILSRVNISDAFVKCYRELKEKRISGILPKKRIDQLSESLHTALKTQPLGVFSEVSSKLKREKRTSNIMRQTLKFLLGKRLGLLMPLYLKFKGGRVYKSVLEAAGYKLDESIDH